MSKILDCVAYKMKSRAEHLANVFDNINPKRVINYYLFDYFWGKSVSNNVL